MKSLRQSSISILLFLSALSTTRRSPLMVASQTITGADPDPSFLGDGANVGFECITSPLNPASSSSNYHCFYRGRPFPFQTPSSFLFLNCIRDISNKGILEPHNEICECAVVIGSIEDPSSNLQVCNGCALIAQSANTAASDGGEFGIEYDCSNVLRGSCVGRTGQGGSCFRNADTYDIRVSYNVRGTSGMSPIEYRESSRFNDISSGETKVDRFDSGETLLLSSARDTSVRFTYSNNNFCDGEGFSSLFIVDLVGGKGQSSNVFLSACGSNRLVWRFDQGEVTVTRDPCCSISSSPVPRTSIDLATVTTAIAALPPRGKTYEVSVSGFISRSVGKTQFPPDLSTPPSGALAVGETYEEPFGSRTGTESLTLVSATDNEVIISWIVDYFDSNPLNPDCDFQHNFRVPMVNGAGTSPLTVVHTCSESLSDWVFKFQASVQEDSSAASPTYAITVSGEVAKYALGSVFPNGIVVPSAIAVGETFVLDFASGTGTESLTLKEATGKQIRVSWIVDYFESNILGDACDFQHDFIVNLAADGYGETPHTVVNTCTSPRGGNYAFEFHATVVEK